MKIPYYTTIDQIKTTASKTHFDSLKMDGEDFKEGLKKDEGNHLKRTAGNGFENGQDVVPVKISKGDGNCKCQEVSKHVSNLEEKLDKYQSTNKIVIDGLNSKVDKLIRLLSDLTEKESKMTKNLASLSKMLEKQEEKSKPSPNQSLGVFLQTIQNNGQGPKKPKNPTNNDPPVIQRKPVDELEELRWGQNTYLLGDSTFNMLLKVDDVKEKLEKMKKSLSMTIRAKDKATVGSLYDRSRDKFIFAMPMKVNRVVLSIGSQDLFDDSFLTLKQASLEDLKHKNRSKLKEKAGHVKAMIQKLINMGKTVVYILPAPCVQRKEVFQHFEEIFQEVCQDLQFPNFRMLNFPELMYYFKSSAKLAILIIDFENVILTISFPILDAQRRQSFPARKSI